MRLRIALLAFAMVLLGTGIAVVPALSKDAAPADATGEIIDAQPAAPAAEEPIPPPLPTATPTPEPEPSPDPEPEPVVETPLTPLQERLTVLLTDPDLPAADQLGVVVIDEAEQVVFGHSVDVPLLPASTQKLVVAAGAMARLGPDFRFTTLARSTAPVGPDGVMAGDLVLIGGGDPALATPTFATHVSSERPRTPLEALADQIVASGVRHVAGAIIGDGTVLPHQPEGPGWLPRYISGGDAVRSSGLTVNAGRRVFQRDGRWHSEAAADPAGEAAGALAELLIERDVTIGGGVAAAASPIEAPHELGSIASPPLLELLRYTVQRSDNHLADAIFRAVGRADGDGSWESAAAAHLAVLAPLGIDWTSAVLADGSGLSRSDRLTAGMLAALDARMSRASLAGEWQSLMAVSGESGTLRRRLPDTIASRRLLGKTGSLRDVRSLSGAVMGPDGARYHFAVIGNSLDEAGVAAVRRLQDELVLALAEDLLVCTRIPIPPPPPEPITTPEGEVILPDAPVEPPYPDEWPYDLTCAHAA